MDDGWVDLETQGAPLKRTATLAFGKDEREMENLWIHENS